jgi:hypothetical protein
LVFVVMLVVSFVGLQHLQQVVSVCVEWGDLTAEYGTCERGETEVQLQEGVEVAHRTVVLQTGGYAQLAVGGRTAHLTLLLS